MIKKSKKNDLVKGISQRKNGKFTARFVSKSRLNSDGKPLRIEKYFDTYEEAKVWLPDAKYEDRHGMMASNMTVDAWYKQWIGDKMNTQKPNTVRNYSERYVRNIQPCIGGMLIKDVKPVHCQNILNRMSKDYAGSTINLTLQTIKVMFNSAENNDVIKKCPTKGVKCTKKIDKNVRFLTNEEHTKFLEVAKGTSNYSQYRFLLETGLRTGEMIGLKWSDLDFEKRTIKVQRQLEFRYSTQEWRWGDPKSNSGFRTIPMTDTCYQLLIDLKEERRQSTVVIKNDEFKDVVFINRNGTPTKNSTYDSHLTKLALKAGIEHFSMHSLRHTFATRCIDAGIDPKTLQKILGHAHLSMTMDLYVHVSDDKKFSEMKKLEQYAVI